MNIICIDIETFYGDNYSLSKLTTEEYVRGDEFEVIGLAVRVNDGPTDWLSGPLPDLKDYLLENYDWENSAVLAHNMMFDGFILSYHFGIRPWRHHHSSTTCKCCLHVPDQQRGIQTG